MHNIKPKNKEMNTYYECKGILKRFAQDDFNKGELDNTGGEFFIDHRIQGHSVKKVVVSAMQFVGAKGYSVDKHNNAFNFHVLEDFQGMPANDRQIEVWKKGKLALYSCDYSIQVYKVQSELVDANKANLR